MFTNKKDPLVDAVKSVMNEGNLKRQVEEAVNNHFGVSSRKAIPHEHLAEYDALLSEAYKYAMKEEKGSEPRNEKEANLAKMKPPHDKITHADVLNGRGVIRQEETQLDEKAVSKAQHRFFGLVRGIQKGQAHGSAKAEKAAKEMSTKEVRKFAKTKEKGLPEKKVDKSNSTIRTNRPVNEDVESIMEEIRVNLEEQLMEAYATGDSEVFENFVLSLNEEQKEILGLNEVFGDYAGDPSILSRASRQTYSNQQRQAAGQRTVSVDRPAPTSRSAPAGTTAARPAPSAAPAARPAAPTGTAARPAAPAARPTPATPNNPAVPSTAARPAAPAARPAAQMGPRQSPSDMGAPPAGSPQYQGAEAAGRANLAPTPQEIARTSPVKPTFEPRAQPAGTAASGAGNSDLMPAPATGVGSTISGVEPPAPTPSNEKRGTSGALGRGYRASRAGSNGVEQTNESTHIRESLESFIRNKFIKG